MEYAVTAGFLLAVVAGSFATVIFVGYGIAHLIARATARLRCRMLWNAAVVLIIVVAFGTALFALATDDRRRPSDRA
jgi:hypothetical protein